MTDEARATDLGFVRAFDDPPDAYDPPVTDKCHGCKRDLPDGVVRLIVHSTAFRGMRQWCEDCQRKGKHR